MPRYRLGSLARCVAAAALAAAAHGALAHDVPQDVKIQAFVRPSGQVLQLLVRVPLAAMSEVDVPRRGPGYLDLARADAALRQSAHLWLVDNIEIREGDERLGPPKLADARVTLPSNRSFGSFEEALAHLGARACRRAWTSTGTSSCSTCCSSTIRSETSDFSIHPKLARLGLKVATVLRFLPPGGEVRAFESRGDPGLIRLDPRWHQAALQFVKLGFVHILEGADHLLFLLCLVVPMRRLWPLVVVATSFTLAHSITLIASALGYVPGGLWFAPLVETLIAVSILYMAVENALGTSLQRRWMLAFAFGLVHGFGFSFALRESLQFAGSHLLTSLLSFNVGVELGQLFALALLLPAAALLFRYVPERAGIIIVSVLAGHAAWHWMLERGEKLLRFPLPAPDAASLASALRWLMGLVIVGALAWAAHRWLRHQAEGRRGVTSGPEGEARRRKAQG